MTQTWIISTCLCVTCIDITNSTLSSSFRYHESSQMSSLVETFISKASALQRQGRAGRVRNGFCFRLYPKYRYEAHRPLMQRAGWNQVQKARNTSLYHLIKNAVSRKDSKQNLSSFRSCANLLCSFFFFFFLNTLLNLGLISSWITPFQRFCGSHLRSFVSISWYLHRSDSHRNKNSHTGKSLDSSSSCPVEMSVRLPGGLSEPRPGCSSAPVGQQCCKPAEEDRSVSPWWSHPHPSWTPFGEPAG